MVVKRIALGWASADFFCKGQDSKFSRLCGPYTISVTSSFLKLLLKCDDVGDIGFL